MTKTKRQLRAEAVERLENAQSDNLEWMLLGDECPNWVNYDTLSYNKAVRARLIDMLTDNETCPNSNGTCPDADGTASIAQGDAVAIMRDCSAMAHGMGALRDKLGIDCVAGWQMRCLSALADMVERDYVRLGYHHKTMNESAARLAKVLDERDELREENDSLREWKACYERMTAERDELQRQLGTMRDVTREFRDERDGWKAKADKLTERMDKRENTMRRLAKLVDVTPEAEYSYNGDPQSVVDGGDFGELATLVFGAVRRLMSERGEWKAKAEQAQESYLDAKHDRDAWHERYVKLQGSNDGVKQSMTNLDAQSRAEIEDMKRSRAVSGDLPQDADVDSSEGAKAAREPREDAREGEADSREKLEEDIADCINTDTAEEYMQFFGDIQSWLDRQAAITERECREYENALREQHHKRIAELKAELKAERGYSKTQRNNFEQATGARKHWQEKFEEAKRQVDELQAELRECDENRIEFRDQRDYLQGKVDELARALAAERDESELARELGYALAERDMYREKLEAELNRTCTAEYDGKWLVCSECGESLQWFGVRTVYKANGKQERALGVDGVRFCPFCGAGMVDE